MLIPWVIHSPNIRKQACVFLRDFLLSLGLHLRAFKFAHLTWEADFLRRLLLADGGARLANLLKHHHLLLVEIQQAHVVLRAQGTQLRNLVTSNVAVHEFALHFLLDGFF
jgi:hypothetical protein